MSNKVDKLFKDKLEEHSLQPSAQAWEKVEAHLGKKNKMALWLRVAAAVAMLSALTFVVLNWNKNYEEPQKQLVKEEPKQEPVIRKQEVEKPVVKEKQAKQQKTITPKAVDEAVDEPVEPQMAVVIEEPVVETNNQQPITNNQQPVTNNHQKGIVLTYSLPTIKKPEPVEEPIVADTKKTGMQRVLEIAKEVKNGDNPLGELREAKNDILALEFRNKDKKKSNQ